MIYLRKNSTDFSPALCRTGKSFQICEIFGAGLLCRGLQLVNPLINSLIWTKPVIEADPRVIMVMIEIDDDDADNLDQHNFKPHLRVIMGLMMMLIMTWSKLCRSLN